MAWLSLMLISGKHAMKPPKSPHKDETALAAGRGERIADG
jgi:hypothetical protein